METNPCETQTETAVEQLRKLLEAEISPLGEEGDEPNALSDTPFSLFGIFFMGVKYFCRGIQSPCNKGPRFTEDQDAFIEEELTEIESIIISLQDHDCSTEKNPGRRSGDLPLKEVPENVLDALYRRVRSLPDTLESL